MKTIDATGLPCPRPVMMTKTALDTETECKVLVDNEAASNNVRMFASARGCEAAVVKKSDALWEVDIVKKENAGESCDDMSALFAAGPTVFVFSSNAMGRGDDALGETIMKAFIHTATELDKKPDVLVFYNSGVKLAAQDADSAADIAAMEKSGIKVLVCGTCVNYFNLSGKLGAGIISNMYDIINTMNSAGRIVAP